MPESSFATTCFVATAVLAMVLSVFGAIAFGVVYSTDLVYSFRVMDSFKAGATVTVVTRCTNETSAGVVHVVEADDTLQIYYNCPTPINVCTEYVCNGASGECDQLLVSGATCYSDEQCTEALGDNWICSLTNCSCVQDFFTCTIDDDCLGFVAPVGACLEIVCDSGRCVEQLQTLANCSQNGQCVSALGDGYQCDLDTCGCVPIPPCVEDADCPIPINDCSEFVCVTNQCTQQLSPMSNCSTDWDCVSALGDGYQCDLDTCGCVAVPSCVTDEDCPAPINTCTEYVCNAGRCEQELVMGATCYSTEQCQQDLDLGFYCNITACDCEVFVAPNTTLGCSSDSDCLLINNQTCVETLCVNERCEEQLVSGAQCAYDVQCRAQFGLNYQCDSSCLCQQILECIVDADCPILDSACTEFMCVGNRCLQLLTAGSTCFSDEQCAQINDDGNYQCNATTCDCYLNSAAQSTNFTEDINFTADDAFLTVPNITTIETTYNMTINSFVTSVFSARVFEVNIATSTHNIVGLSGAGIHVHNTEVTEDGFFFYSMINPQTIPITIAIVESSSVVRVLDGFLPFSFIVPSGYTQTSDFQLQIMIIKRN